MVYYNPYSFTVAGQSSSPEEQLAVLRKELASADAVVIGAGSGLSTAAGYVYTGERMSHYFSDFREKYGIRDMYSGGFYPYDSLEVFWGFWCRYIWINRYAPIPSDLYERLYALVQEKDYFVLTTNVDHCFQRSGFDKKRLFYTQGDYGLFQSSRPHGVSAGKTYDNEKIIRQMVLSQGFQIAGNGELIIPEGVKLKMTVPTELVPYCPDDGRPMTTNLRSDDTFVEDEGWHEAAERYHRFLSEHEGEHVLYLELGVGGNTPGIIKIPFWRYAEKNKKAFYACINKGEACCPESIEKRSVCINAGADEVIAALEKTA